MSIIDFMNRTIFQATGAVERSRRIDKNWLTFNFFNAGIDIGQLRLAGKLLRTDKGKILNIESVIDAFKVKLHYDLEISLTVTINKMFFP